MEADDNNIQLRRLIKKFFTSRSNYLAEESLTYFAEQLAGVDRKHCYKTMEMVTHLVEKKGGSNLLLTLEQLKEILKEVYRHKKNESEIPFKIVSIFDWRKELVEDKRRSSKKIYNQVQSGWEKLSIDAYRQRFDLIKALLEEGIDQFDPIDSMLTRRNCKVRILAQLCRGSDGTFTAEDPTGAVQLNLDSAIYQDGLYFEGGTFDFEGICSSGGNKLEVENVKLPLLKSLELTEPVDGREKSKKQTVERHRDPNDRFVFMSDVYLDNKRVLKALYHILQGFSSSPPNIFILCGSFVSIQQAHGYTDQALIAFQHFANILSEFSHNYMNTDFILVPSAEDPSPAQVFPRPPLLPSVQKCFKDLKNVHFASNPCKLIFKDHHILIYRDDMVEKLCRSANFMPRNAKAQSIPKLFCDTIWSQRHVSPLPLFNSPIIPHFDPLFQLLPAPDVLVIADRFTGFFEADNERRRLTLNPGPFSSGDHFEFQVYFPALRRVEHSAYNEELE